MKPSRALRARRNDPEAPGGSLARLGGANILSGPGAANVAQRVAFAPGRPARGMKNRHERSDRLETDFRLSRARWSDSFMAIYRQFPNYRPGARFRF